MARSKKEFSVKDLIFIAVFTAAICLVAPWTFGWNDALPVTAATGIICFTAAVLGFKRSLICVVIYLVLGALGVPVMAGWTGGYTVFTGNRLGYLLGYLLLAVVTGLIVDRNHRNAYMYFVGITAGAACCCLLGSLWLLISVNMNFTEALNSGLMPFLTSECIKIFLAGMLAYPVRAILLKKIL